LKIINSNILEMAARAEPVEDEMNFKWRNLIQNNDYRPDASVDIAQPAKTKDIKNRGKELYAEKPQIFRNSIDAGTNRLFPFPDAYRIYKFFSRINYNIYIQQSTKTTIDKLLTDKYNFEGDSEIPNDRWWDKYNVNGIVITYTNFKDREGNVERHYNHEYSKFIMIVKMGRVFYPIVFVNNVVNEEGKHSKELSLNDIDYGWMSVIKDVFDKLFGVKDETVRIRPRPSPPTPSPPTPAPSPPTPAPSPPTPPPDTTDRSPDDIVLEPRDLLQPLKKVTITTGEETKEYLIGTENSTYERNLYSVELPYKLAGRYYSHTEEHAHGTIRLCE
jgi:hypothetical protein